MSLGAFAQGFAGGMNMGRQWKKWNEEDQLKKLQAEEFGKVGQAANYGEAMGLSEGQQAEMLKAQDAEFGDAGYKATAEGLNSVSADTTKADPTKMRPVTERDATEGYLRRAQAGGLIDPMAAMDVRAKAKQAELADYQLGEARSKADVRKQFDAIGQEETDLLGRWDTANARFNEAKSALENPTSEQVEQLRKQHLGGLRMPENVRLEMAHKRAMAAQKAGDFQAAKSIMDDGNSRAAVAFNRALIGGDLNLAGSIYNAFPNGHRIAKLMPGKEEGTVDVVEADGSVRAGIKVRDLVNSATELIKPGTVAASLQKDEQYEQMLKRLQESQDGKVQLAELRAHLRSSGGGSGRRSSGGGGSGGGDVNSAAQPNLMPIKDFKSFVPEGTNVPAAYSFYVQAVQGAARAGVRPDLVQSESMRHALDLANGTKQVTPSFDNRTLGYSLGFADEKNNRYVLQDNIDPTVVGIKTSETIKQADAVVRNLEQTEPELIEQAKRLVSERVIGPDGKPTGKTKHQALTEAYAAGAGLSLAEVRLMNAAHLLNRAAWMPKDDKRGGSGNKDAGPPGPLSQMAQGYTAAAGMAGESFKSAFNRLLEMHPDNQMAR